MPLRFTPEQEELAAVVRRFLATHSSEAHVRTQMQVESGYGAFSIGESQADTVFAAASSTIVTSEPTPFGPSSSATIRHSPVAMRVLRPETVPVDAPTATRVTSKLPPAFPALHTLIVPTRGVEFVRSPTAKLDFGTNALLDCGAFGESEHAARNASPNPALAMSATCLFIRMCVSVSSLL